MTGALQLLETSKTQDPGQADQATVLERTAEAALDQQP